MSSPKVRAQYRSGVNALFLFGREAGQLELSLTQRERDAHILTCENKMVGVILHFDFDETSNYLVEQWGF